MRKLTTRFGLLSAVSALGVIMLLALTGCGNRGGKKADEPSAEDFAPYIKAYTGGIVTQDAVIRIDLTEDAALMPTDGLFTTSPKTEGTVNWISSSSVTYTPEKLLVGKNYNVRFALGKVMEKAPAQFNFSITVKGIPEPEEEPEEADNGEPFRVKKASLQHGSIEVVLSGEPVNAKVKGLVELTGAARSYVQVNDNVITVHFEGAKDEMTLTIDQALKDTEGNTLGRKYTRTFSQGEEKPAIEIPLKGNILPDKEALVLPFRAVNLGAVEVRVIKIYEKNVLSFLQDNDLDGQSNLRRNGRLIYRGDVTLDATKDLRKWNTHSIDLSGLFKQEPGAIYRIRLSFREDQSLWGGKEYMRSPTAPSGKPTEADESIWDTPNIYYWDNDYDWEKYNWKEADDPSKPSYYMDSDRFPAVQLIASDLGLMAGYSGGDRIWITATDLITAQPVSGAQVEVYDFQLQSLSKGNTDGNGLAELPVSHKPFAVVAKAGGSTAYLKVTDGNERSLSRFDVGGETITKGLKCFIYGERGVWRPGDTLHVTAIVADKNKSLPEGHPATLEVYTPQGQFYAKYVRKGKDSFYSFSIPTKADDPTGYWNAYLKVGGSSFHKTLHIETIKPNRLKINTSYPDILQAGEKITVKTEASWLTGGVAGGNDARAQMTLRKVGSTAFKGFENYTFNNPASQFTSAEYELYKGRMDAQGNFSAQVQLPLAQSAPGMLRATIVTSVEEPGGDESFTTETLPYSPYSAYVGLKVPEGEYLETDKDQVFKIASVDARGNRIKGRKIEYAVYKVGWNWWWDNPGGDLDAYVSGNSVKKIANGNVVSGNTDVSFTVREEYPEWGRYLILARDAGSGHVTGNFVTFDWPEYRGRASRQDPEALTMITFSTDKKSYTVGEKATVYIPGAKNGKALVSLENAGGIISRSWVKTSENDTPYEISITPEMAPNFYINITLLQPYGNSANDLPIRLYGVQRVNVENPGSHLAPAVTIPDILHPEEEFTVKVTEKSGKPMTYTLAIVDEGLLDLTAFKTPDPWSRMYRPEALGVKTWDLYDQVIGAYGAKLSPLASIGGDEDAIKNARKDNRFNPAVLFVEPRTLKAKGTDVLKLKLPMYVGSVRVMLIAAHDGAYGNTEKTVTVQNPLMVVTTLPRILGNGEEVKVPVNVFAMEEGVKEANVSIKADGPASIVGPATQKLSFSGKGDKLVSFGLKANGEGVTHVTVDASGSGHKASETIALTVQNPYPEVTKVERFVLEKGQSRDVPEGSTVQLAGFPALDARKLYLDMKQYPYSCGEQLSARGITILSLIPMLGAEDKASAKALIPELIQALYSRQNQDGGFAYWSGGKSDPWVSSMAGHFLTLAGKDGFAVNPGVVKSWKSYEKKMSQAYRLLGNDWFPQLDEAYRLYALALAGEPNLSSMNRLKESGKLGERARWMLASAYAISGKKAQADALLEGIGKEFPEYEPYNLTFGTSTRDRMVALEALVRTDRIADALALASEELPVSHLSTQESAFTAIAYRALYDKVPASAPSVKENAKKVENTTEGRLYGTILTASREPRSKALSNGLKLEVKYVGEDGKALSPQAIDQGTCFKAVIKVTNASPARAYESLALSLAIPSGWEIINDRLTGAVTEEDGYDHLDIRDTRADWFFGLPAGRFKTFTIGLRAAYAGSYVMPATVCQAMYEPAVNASTADGTAVVQ
ncbi:MAG: alpha-2-macroglobulin [Bacteroidales bacterium]|nr:alpha-2-macroglobulin [Bacteroidales bacterium]